MRKIGTSYRIMKIFAMLYKKPHSFDDIFNALYKDDIHINKETLSKYLKTLRAFGCRIEKHFGKFTLISVPFSLDFSKENFYSLAITENLVSNLYGDDIKNDFKMAIDKILSLTDNASFDVYGDYVIQSNKLNSISMLYKEKISKLSKFGYKDSKIKILYLDRKINVSNVSFKYYDNSVFVHVYNEDTKACELLLLENIKEIYPSPESISSHNFSPNTVFTLFGRLKKSYSLHKGERVIASDKDSITISNNEEDKKQILKRLVRYQKLCKIEQSKADVNNFVSMLDTMINNLENNSCEC